MSKLVVVLGPTATGKTSLAVNLATHFNGEIISADSRQIYKNLDIGTGKDLEEYVINNVQIPYHLIDILSSNQNYSVFKYKKDFLKVYKQIIKRNHLPILCGGTALYIESILLNYKMPNVPPDINLRQTLENKSQAQLIKEMKMIDANSYDINYHVTKRRIIRTIEILSYEGQHNNINNNFETPSLVLGIKLDRSKILQNIKKRLKKRLQQGMVEEVKELIDNGMTLNRLRYFGLEYKFIGEYLFHEISYEEMKEKLNFAINRFSKKQMTFFRRMEKRGINIKWIKCDDYKTIHNQINKFLSG